ncbi:MAG: DUF423 domain-containing protein [Alphaproteobacteria bacterium]|jgi:uncharacterized membrane protein YgdD (TMEM256/DUF423 family)
MNAKPQTGLTSRWMVVAGALAGAFGVAFAAAAAHRAETFAAAASMLLAHAPVLLILGFGGAARLRFGTVCASLVIAGLVLFAGDIGLRGFVGSGLFAFAAPIGGSLLIVSWLAIAFAALFARRNDNDADGGKDA